MEEVFICPHCKGYFIVEKINCGIFRHGISKTSGHQMNPHTPKEDCDRMVNEELIWGCGKPFKWDGKQFIICDYI